MSGVLEIQPDTQETQASQPASEVGLQDLPEYLQVEGDESKTPVAISIVAVCFFLLTTVGLAAATQYYLVPQRTEATTALEEKETELKSVTTKIEREEKKGEEHLKKLRDIQEKLTSSDRPERTQVGDTVSEIHRIARDIALKRRREAGFGFVIVQTLNVQENGEIAVGGSVDSFLTLADWFEALETSDAFQGLKLSTAAESGEGGVTSVPYNFSFTRQASTVPKQSTKKAIPDALPGTSTFIAPLGTASDPSSVTPPSTTPSGVPAPSIPPTTDPSNIPSVPLASDTPMSPPVAPPPAPGDPLVTTPSSGVPPVPSAEPSPPEVPSLSGVQPPSSTPAPL